MAQLIINVVNATATGSMAIPGEFPGAKGWNAFLNVLVLDGVGQTLAVKIQDSPDGSVWADVKTFATQTGGAAASERKVWSLWDATPIYTAQYLKCVYTVAVDATPLTFQLRLTPIY